MACNVKMARTEKTVVQDPEILPECSVVQHDCLGSRFLRLYLDQTTLHFDRLPQHHGLGRGWVS